MVGRKPHRHPAVALMRQTYGIHDDLCAPAILKRWGD
ncbi:MAG: hypothetical protein K0S45_3792, partial [Nitrospira sp.]|nr:hypothetical protein [Nitrospira sp.]